MKWIRALFDRQAVVAVALVTAAINLAVAFGAPIDDTQQGAVIAVVTAVGGLLASRFVWSASTHTDEVDQAYDQGVQAGGRNRRDA